MTKKILIAEDEKDILKMFSDMLKTAGYEVEEAEDGEEAIKKLAIATPDLLLLDLQMPNKDGFGVIEWMVSEGKINDTKVIVLSNIDQPEWVNRAMELGAHDYWMKIDTHLTDLIAKVNKILS